MQNPRFKRNSHLDAMNVCTLIMQDHAKKNDIAKAVLASTKENNALIIIL